MALIVEQLKRKFMITRNGKEITLDDIPGLTPEEVKKHYIPMYPELTNATVEGPKVVGETSVYTLNAQIGHKG